MTPTARASAETETKGAVAALPWWIVTGMIVLSIVIGAIEGGLMWVGTAVVVVAGALWIGMDQLASRRLGRAEAEADDRTVNRVALTAVAVVVLGVMAFMSLMGIIIAAS